MKNAPKPNRNESALNKRDYSPGILPIRLNTVMAAVLACLLESKVMTSMDSVIAQSTTRLSTIIHALQKSCKMEVEMRYVTTRTSDGRVVCIVAYLLSKETIARAHEMGAQSWIDDVKVAQAKIKPQIDKKKKIRRNQLHEQDPRQGNLWDELSRARDEESVSSTHAADHGRAIFPSYGTYEERKKKWDCQHPDATSEQRDAAINRIVRELGV